MTRLFNGGRGSLGSWAAASMCSVALVLGCGGGAAPDVMQRATGDEESSQSPSDDTVDAVDSDEPNASGSGAEGEGRRVVGYVQTFRLADNPDLHLDTLTHLILAFVAPDKQDKDKLSFEHGQPDEIARVVKAAHAANVKVLAALDGGSGGGATAARLAAGVDSYVASVIDLVEQYELDGIDVDIEGDAINPHTYEPLMLGLSEKLRSYPERKLLTAAVSNYQRENYRVLGAVDFLNIMSYDQCGDWGEATACEHSTLAQAQVDLDYWSHFEQADATGTVRKIGAPNVTLGVPFYGRCWGKRCPEPVPLAYEKIAAYCRDGVFVGCSSSADVVTDGDPYLGYYLSLNSPQTLATKAEKAKNYGGIMIWELGQDSRDGTLFAPIAEAFAERRGVAAQSEVGRRRVKAPAG